MVGSVTGLSGLVAGLGGAAFTFFVGAVVDRFSYRPAFLAAGLLPVIATAFVLLLVKEPSGNGTNDSGELRGFSTSDDAKIGLANERRWGPDLWTSNSEDL